MRSPASMDTGDLAPSCRTGVGAAAGLPPGPVQGCLWPCGHRPANVFITYMPTLMKMRSVHLHQVKALETRTETPCCEGVMWQ